MLIPTDNIGPASEGRGEAAAPQRRDPRHLGRLSLVTLAALPARACSRPARGTQVLAVRSGAPKMRP